MPKQDSNILAKKKKRESFWGETSLEWLQLLTFVLPKLGLWA